MTDADPKAVKGRVRQHWRRRAADFDDEPQHAIHDETQHRRWLEVLDEWTAEPPTRTLDVGCGTGTLSVLLAELGRDVLGVDAAPEMVARARRKANEHGTAVAVGLGDATTLGLVEDAVGQIVERHLLWTLPEPAEAVAEWRRVVEPGGRIVLFEGRWEHDEHRDEYADVHEDLPLYDGRTGEEWAELLDGAGLRDVAFEPLPDPVLRGQEPGTDLSNDYVVVAGTVPE